MHLPYCLDGFSYLLIIITWEGMESRRFWRVLSYPWLVNIQQTLLDDDLGVKVGICILVTAGGIHTKLG